MAMRIAQQLWVPIGLPDDQEIPGPSIRRSRRWLRAIRRLLCDSRLKTAVAIKKLPLPSTECCDAWYVVRKGTPFRCCYAWVMFPTDGGRPGYRGRVDVLVEGEGVD